jgi:sterol desaturase/sphingolipid hydroxylase (fatty acid hydroxylase superfamily)
MEDLGMLLERAAAPFHYPFDPSQRIYFLYLASAIALGFLAYNAGAGRRGGAVLPGFLRSCFDKKVFLHPSARVDYLYFVVNRIAFPLLFGPLVVGAAAASAGTAGALAALLGPEGPGLAGGPATTLVFTLLTVLALDAGLFAAHWLQHRVPLLWEFHKVHHSAEVLTPITAYRMHPVDSLLSGWLSGLMTGVLHGVFVYLCVASPGIYLVLGLNAGLFAFYLTGYNLRHSHLWLAYPRPLSHILISPAQHQVHHSREPRHFDRNMGFIFAFWDWMAGTLYVPQGRESLQFGLGGEEHKDFNGVIALYLLPLRNVARRLKGARKAVP